MNIHYLSGAAVLLALAGIFCIAGSITISFGRGLGSRGTEIPILKSAPTWLRVSVGLMLLILAVVFGCISIRS